MIKFFRKIRQKLLSENKFSKYLLYAIGEIVLVVIGILIALQINNWNENKKNERIQYESLYKLKLDLEYDLVQFRNLDSIYKEWDYNYEFIVNNVLAGKLDKLTSPDQYGIGKGSLFYLTIKQTTYNEMISMGSFYRIKNESIGQNISGYYEYANFEKTKLNRDNQNLADYVLSPAMKEQKNITFRLAQQRNLEYIDWTWLKDPNSELYKELENRATWFYYALKANRLVLGNLKEKSNNLIEQLNSEIRNNKG